MVFIFPTRLRHKPPRSEVTGFDATWPVWPPPNQARLAIPLCEHVPILDSAERSLGALCVVEGSTLGGRTLALRLDGICGVGVADGR